MTSTTGTPGIRAAARVAAMPRSGIRETLAHIGDPGLVDLAGGDPDFRTPPHILEAAKRALDEGRTHYTSSRGIGELRHAFARKLTRENSLPGIDPETQIVVTTGAYNALAAALLAHIDPGDEVIIPDPSFTSYTSQIALCGARAVFVPCPESQRFVFDETSLRAAAKTARAIILNSPANPTGTVYRMEELEAIARVAEEHDLLVISDEPYEHLVYDGARHISFATLPGMFDRTVTIFSMSKSWAMTGWRVGFAVGPTALLRNIDLVQENLVGSSTTMTQWAAIAALEGLDRDRTAMVDVYRSRRDRIVAALQDHPSISLIAPQGGFFAFPRFNVTERGEDLAALVRERAGVLAVPGIVFGPSAGAHMRLSFAGPDSALDEGLARLRAATFASSPTH